LESLPDAVDVFFEAKEIVFELEYFCIDGTIGFLNGGKVDLVKHFELEL